MENKLHVLHSHIDTLMDLPNVVGAGIGYKVRAGEVSDEHAIVVLVTHKVSKAYLPETSIIPSQLSNMITDVKEVGEIRLFANTDKMRPARPGTSIGHYKITAGTFGAVVYDQATGVPLILSNNHVLANASFGNDGRCTIGDPIYQPGSYDGGTSSDTIANLYRFVPYASTSTVDCALAKPISDDLINSDILDIGKVAGTIDATLNLPIRKSGRTTGLTSGTIDVMHSSVRVDIGDGRVITFEDQLVAGAMSQGGDSGSLAVDKNNNAVGLLFAGSTTITIFNPITSVLSALKVRF